MSTAEEEAAGSTTTATSEQHRQAREALGLTNNEPSFSDMPFLSRFCRNPVAALYQVTDPDQDPTYTKIDFLKFPKETPLHTLAKQLKYDKPRGRASSLSCQCVIQVLFSCTNLLSILAWAGWNVHIF